MTFDELLAHVKSNLGDEVIVGTDINASPNAIIVSADKLKELMQFLHEDNALYFDSLSCISALDNGAEEDSIEVIYNLYAIPFDHHLMVKVSLDRNKPQLDSLVDIWQTANWHEREAYDLLGVNFVGHPDLRRILLPADWEGHPLRKDYEEQQYYRGVKVKY